MMIPDTTWLINLEAVWEETSPNNRWLTILMTENL